MINNLKNTGSIVSINGIDYYIWLEFKEVEGDESQELSINGTKLHVIWTVRELRAVDYQAENIQPSGEQAL